MKNQFTSTHLKKIILFSFILSTFTSFAQFSGNQIYGNNNRHNRNNTNYNKKRTVYSTDSTLTITVNLLMNKIADHYLISIGVNEEAKTAMECNTKINKRINALIASLNTLEIDKENVYVDFISQTKIYDYDVKEKEAQQFEKGFELKKNLIIRVNHTNKLDNIITLCAKQNIFDIIKVEYIDTDINGSYIQLYTEAITLIESRKKLYLKTTQKKTIGSSSIFSENFNSLSPKNLYKKYEAFESSYLNVYNRNYTDHYLKKEARKQRTYYYEGQDASNFDKVINPSNPKVGIQYTFSLTLTYNLKK